VADDVAIEGLKTDDNEGFTLTVTDGTGASDSQTLTINIIGVNDPATIGGDGTGAVSEDILVDGDGNITDSGTLTITDPDNGEASFNVGTITGIYGSLNIDASGNWSYAADNSQSVIQDLVEYETLTDIFTVYSVDNTPHNVVITINGTEDVPPTVDSVIMSDSGTPLKIGDVRMVTVTFSEAVNFSNADITAENGIFGTFTSDPTEKVWTATFTPTNGIEDDANIVTVLDTYTDKFENVGSGAVSANYEIDTIAPGVAVTGITDDSAGASSTDFITSDDTLIISGSYEAADTNGTNVLEVMFNGNTYTLGTDAQLTAIGDSWQLDLTGAAGLADNSYNVVATATDTAGNSSSASQVIIIDTAPPDVAITGITDDSAGTSNSDFITNDDTLIISGSFESADAAVLTVAIDSTTYTLGTDAQLTSTGDSWQLDLTGATALVDDSYSVVATATDAAGNINSAVQSIVIDTIKPGTPTISESVDNVDPVQGNVANGGYTNDTTLTLAGTAEKDSRVTIYDGALLIAAIWADGAGAWSYNLAALLDGSTHSYKITATDAAGNVSADSSAYVLHVDTTVTAPTIELATDAGNNILGTFIVGGTEAGATVEYSVNGTDWSTTAPGFIENSDNTVYVRQTDLAGNISTSTLLEFTNGSATANTITGDGNDNILIGGAGNDILDGAGGDDTLYGDGGDDELTGGAGTNTLYGGDGNDTLIGGAGNNAMYGGPGSDTASYAGVGAGTVITASLTAGSGGDGTYTDTYDGIENLTGGAGNDILEGNSSVNTLSGGDGDDQFLGSLGDDTYYGNINGTPGVDLDTVSYASLNVAIDASLTTGTGGDGSFTDTYHDIENLTGGSQADTLYGDGNDSILAGGNGTDHLWGMGGDDIIYGGSTDGTGDASGDYFYGGDGNDLFYAGSGADHFFGNTDTDSGAIGEYDTVSFAHSGQGVIISLAYGWSFGGYANGNTYDSIENFIGSDGVDYLEGDGGANVLDGGAGNDTLIGGAGNDTIWANQGADTVKGEGDNDTIHVDAINLPGSVDGGTGTDTVVVHGLDINPYDLSALASKLNYIEKLDISDGVDTAMTISTQDIQDMVDNGNSSELTIMADSGDSLVLAAGDSFVGPAFDSGSPAGDYNISDGGGLSATIHWVIA
jgi:VCBS repeat-containing protein